MVRTISFDVSNSPDNSWGMVLFSVCFLSNIRMSKLMSLDTHLVRYRSSIVEPVGWMFQVTWKFDVSWNWNDLNELNWIARAIDGDGVSIWPANSVNGSMEIQLKMTYKSTHLKSAIGITA